MPEAFALTIVQRLLRQSLLKFWSKYYLVFFVKNGNRVVEMALRIVLLLTFSLCLYGAYRLMDRSILGSKKANQLNQIYLHCKKNPNLYAGPIPTSTLHMRDGETYYSRSSGEEIRVKIWKGEYGWMVSQVHLEASGTRTYQKILSVVPNGSAWDSDPTIKNQIVWDYDVAMPNMICLPPAQVRSGWKPGQ